MHYRNVGKSGLSVSAVGLGCNNFGWNIDLEGARAVVHAALDAGVTLLDTANVYGDGNGASETCIGQILGERRKDIVLATKFGMPFGPDKVLKGASRRAIMSAVEDSLTRLKTDWIDLYQIHTPDPLTPLEETLRALDDLISQGKVRYVGCSNHPAWQLADAAWIARDEKLNGFISAQDEYSLLARKVEKELIPAAEKFGMGLLPYFPLASGLLTGKYKKGAPPPEGARLTKAPLRRLADRFLTEHSLGVAEKLGDWASQRGRTILELAFSWLLAHPVVSSVIAGATRPEQIRQNVVAADWALTKDELAEIDAIAPA